MFKEFRIFLVNLWLFMESIDSGYTNIWNKLIKFLHEINSSNFMMLFSEADLFDAKLFYLNIRWWSGCTLEIKIPLKTFQVSQLIELYCFTLLFDLICSNLNHKKFVSFVLIENQIWFVVNEYVIRLKRNNMFASASNDS